MIKLFVGLGNPGEKYKNTRHNFGFKALDCIVESLGQKWKTDNMADISVSTKASFIKPVTYMNLSGEPLAAFMKYYKIKPSEILVFYDDFAVAFGSWKIRMSGSAGGHNGISSIISCLGTQEFARVKLGIGPLPEKIPTANFVLSNFPREDNETVNNVLNKCVELFNAVDSLGLEKGWAKVMETLANNSGVN
ncbi:MAG: aminoacyl-tRNA hydrolase [Elusimicrobia bacterium]|nr:aminoacyl-tRNA hydrolase [Elusimicrobiota bacterium]